MVLGTVFLGFATIEGMRYFSTGHKVAQFWVGRLVFLVSLLVASVFGLVAAVGMSIAGRRSEVNWLVAKTFYGIASWWLGIQITVEGAEHLEVQPAVFVGNHQSMLDLFYLGRMFPKHCAILAKKSIQYIPVLGQWMWLSGAVFINRSNSKEAMASLNEAGKQMKERAISLWIFPEGTRTLFEAPGMLPFKKGAFHLAVEAQVPIIPVVCENYWRLYHENCFEKGDLRVRVLPPISTIGLTAADVGKLATDTRDAMLKALKEISVPVTQEVQDADDAAMAKISKQTHASGQVAPLSAESAPTSTPPSASAPPPSYHQGDMSSSSVSDVSSREIKTTGSEASTEDDELVIVDRPTGSA